MKTEITYFGEFQIPVNPTPSPQVPGRTVDSTTVEINNGKLVVQYGESTTTFPVGSWYKSGDWYVVYQGAVAQYDGMTNKINRAYGIKFPAHHMSGPVESTFGNFDNWGEYEKARKANARR